MVWHDHGTALRAESIIYFALVARKAGYLNNDTKKLINDLLKEHVDYLSNYDNYTKNHNHGIFQDRALIYTAYYLNDEKKDQYLDIAKERLTQQFNYAFTEEMVHVENSPGYAIIIVDMFKDISEFLLQFNDNFGTDLYNKVQKSLDFLTYITKPDATLATIGDTNGLVGKSTIVDNSSEKYKNPQYTYANTLGTKGEQPLETSVFYPKSGYYISHNDWKKEDYINSTWMMFKFGYSSSTHKHSDDNSFMLYSKGYDVFVDTGWYNYTYGNKFRDYFVSALGHNGVIVDGISYSPTTENSNKVGIYDYKREENYDYVVGYNEMYNGVKMDRHFYNLGDVIIIYDDIKSKEIHNYSQLFHTSEYIDVLSKSKNEILYKLGDSGYNVRIKQLLNNTKLNNIKGDFEEEEFGYLPRTMNKVEATNTAKFDIEGSNVSFVTMITIEDKKGNIKNINDIEFDSKNMMFNINNNYVYNIQLQERKRMELNNISISNDDAEYKFINNCKDDKFSYAWYVIDKNTNSPIYKTEFTKSNVFKYNFADKGEYLIRAYIKYESKQKNNSIIATIKYNETTNKWDNITDEYPYLNLKYNGNYYKNTEGNKYEFTVDYNYSLNSKIRWYVYKNGAYYSVEEVVNSNKFEFIEPGIIQFHII
ncbi:alginate lyase family protein [Clostridium sp. ZBS4]|uniref:alginate lyase family protein n=1 Tax=Clostridium sp. ZBS4 TaxID=2949974 RepID=UPI002079C382|nr:alginate lyase family protein [Clostridium sp. ZBS4]